ALPVLALGGLRGTLEDRVDRRPARVGVGGGERGGGRRQDGQRNQRWMNRHFHMFPHLSPYFSPCGQYIRAMRQAGFIAAFAALTALAGSAFPQTAPDPAMSREQALQAIVSPDAATRAEAIVWIADHGGMDDADLLHRRLRDESPFVRGFA